MPLVVDEAGGDPIVSTAQVWTAYAIANGITTEIVTVTNPNAVITLRPGNTADFFAK